MKDYVLERIGHEGVYYNGHIDMHGTPCVVDSIETAIKYHTISDAIHARRVMCSPYNKEFIIREMEIAYIPGPIVCTGELNM